MSRCLLPPPLELPLGLWDLLWSENKTSKASMIYPLSVPFPVVHDQGMEAALLLSAQGGPGHHPGQTFSTASFSKSSTEVFRLQSMHQMSKFCPFQLPHEKNLPCSSLPRHQLWNLCFGPVSKTTLLTQYSNKAFASLKSLNDWFIHF